MSAQWNGQITSLYYYKDYYYWLLRLLKGVLQTLRGPRTILWELLLKMNHGMFLGFQGRQVKGRKAPRMGERPWMQILPILHIFFLSQSHTWNCTCFIWDPDPRWISWSPYLLGWVLLFDCHLLAGTKPVGNYAWSCWEFMFATNDLLHSMSSGCTPAHHKGLLMLMLDWIGQEITMLCYYRPESSLEAWILLLVPVGTDVIQAKCLSLHRNAPGLNRHKLHLVSEYSGLIKLFCMGSRSLVSRLAGSQKKEEEEI